MNLAVTTVLNYLGVTEAQFGAVANIAVALVTFFVAIATWKAAKAAERSAASAKTSGEAQLQTLRLQEEMRMAESRPLLVLDLTQGMPLEKVPNEPGIDGYPVLLHYRNGGRGPAKVMVVRLHRPRTGEEVPLVTHIGLPITVPPGGSTHIKIWLVDRESMEELQTSLFYWGLDPTGQFTAQSQGYVNRSIIRLGWGTTVVQHEGGKERIFFARLNSINEFLELTPDSPPDEVMAWPCG